eukprot:g3026.t1
MIDKLRLSKKDQSKLWATFNKFDKDKSGTMDMREFYQLIGEPQTIFGDSIFELIDIDNSGTLDFSEFVQALGTFCMFGKVEVMKFCFYIFDKDKNGYIEEDELAALLHKKFPQMLHPAFRVQDKMAEKTLGRNWWIDRKNMFADERAAKMKGDAAEKERATKHAEKQQKQQVMRKMGVVQYYLNCSRRKKYLARPQN